jgi:hypothetical protein
VINTNTNRNTVARFVESTADETAPFCPGAGRRDPIGRAGPACRPGGLLYDPLQAVRARRADPRIAQGGRL